MVRFARLSKEFLKNRLKAVSPDLISFRRWVEVVNCYSVSQFSVPIGESRIDVEEPDSLAVSKFSEIPIDGIYGRYEAHLIVPGEDCREDESGLGRLLAAG